MKAYTDIEQSRKLAEILPLESADMCYLSEESLVPKVIYNGMAFFNSKEERLTNIIHCWSLAALLNVINKTYYVTLLHDGIMWNILVIHHDIDKCNHTIHADSPVDACVEMVLKLYELKMI